LASVGLHGLEIVVQPLCGFINSVLLSVRGKRVAEAREKFGFSQQLLRELLHVIKPPRVDPQVVSEGLGHVAPALKYDEGRVGAVGMGRSTALPHAVRPILPLGGGVDEDQRVSFP
jgi:hypothetical protein